MIRSFTARYTTTPAGYAGQLVEWPEVVAEGRDLEDCREMLRDALREMVLAHQQLGREIPVGGGLIEPLAIDVEEEWLASVAALGATRVRHEDVLAAVREARSDLER